MVLAYLERIWFSYAITKYMLICSTSTFNKYCMSGMIIGSMNALGGKRQTKVSPFILLFFFFTSLRPSRDGGETDNKPNYIIYCCGTLHKLSGLK